MNTVRQLLDSKGRDVWHLGPEHSVLDAIKLMAEREVGALVIMDADKLVGIVTERDYARKVILKGKSSEGTAIREIMTSNVLCARPDQSIEECMALMTNKRSRHLPVIDNGRVDGIISIGDLVKAIIAEQQFVIDQLEHYING